MSKYEPLSIFQEDVEERYNRVYAVSNKRFVDTLPDDCFFPVIGQAVEYYYNEMIIGKDKNIDGYLYSMNDIPDVQGVPEYEGEITAFRNQEGKIKWNWKDKNKQPIEWTTDKLNYFYSELKKRLNEEDEKDIYKESVKDVKEVKKELLEISSPEELSNWMKSHFNYFQHDKENIFSFDEILEKMKGDCYDQVEFEKVMFRKMKIKFKGLFLIEYKKENWQQGYGTHSLLYYENNNKLYWFENAWGSNQGIHGPFKDVDSLKEYLFHKWKFKYGCDRLVITSLGSVKPGISHNDYAYECTKKFKKEPKSYKKEDQNIYMNESVEKKVDPFKAFENDKTPQPKVLTTLLRDFIYPYIEKTLSNPTNVRKFNQLVANFINRNINKLTTSGPVYLVPFTDRDKEEYFKLFDITIKDIKNVMTEHTKTLNGSKFLFLRQNPIYSLFYFTIRYFTIKKDGKSLNSAITIYALANYPTIYTKYFPKGVIEPVMKYTIDNLTDKFLIKKSKHVFGLLVESAQRSYEFLKDGIEKGNDAEVIRFIQRIHNDQNSMFKKISNIYYENHKKGYAVGTTNTQYDDDTPIIDEVDNATTEVQNAVNKVSLPIIANGVDIVRAEASAKMSQIGVSDCRLFLINIMTDKNIIPLQKMIEAILFLYIYESKKTIRDVRSQFFLAWSASLFKKTNSKNKNIVTINTILNTWAEESGIYAKYQREASRTNYKKAIFFYVVLSIQKYIG